MRLVILIFVLLGYGTSIYSQEESQNFLFSGMLIIENGTSIEYIIDVKIDENGNLIGSSKSKLEGAFESTSVLSGYYYWKNKTISFSEVMDSTEVPDSLKLLLQNDTEMCFVKVVDLPIKNLLGKFSFSGDFKGEFASGEKCAQGKISMWGNEFIDFVPKIRIKDDVFQFPENNGSMELINIDDDKLKEVVTAKKNSHLQVVNSSDSV